VDIISLPLHKVIGEFANLSFIDAVDLSIFSGAKRKAGNQVHKKQDDAGHAEGITETSDTIAELVSELDIVVVEPTSWDDSDAVKRSNIICSKETGQEISYHTTNTVDCKDIERIVNADEELEFGCIIANDTADDTEDDSRPRRDVSRCRRDGNKTSNGTRAPTDSGPFAFKAVIDQHPCKSTHRCSKIGDDASHNSAKVAAES